MSARGGPPNWIPYAGLLLSFAGIVYQSGQLTGEIKRNTERIEKLEVGDIARSEAVHAIVVRTTRIEAKLDYAYPQVKEIK